MLAANADAAEVAIMLRDGRVARGTLARQSDDDRLWLMSSAPGIAVKSGFAWDEIRELELDGRQVPPAEFRQQAARQPRGPDLPLPAVVRALPAPPLPAGEVVQPPTPRRGRIVSLEAHAVPANWDTDPELDGLRLFLRPLDGQGRSMPVSGQVDAKLLGDIRTAVSVRNGSPLTQFLELGDWSVAVRSGDFRNGEIGVDLPFTRFDPEVDVRVADTGWLRVRLGIPSEGVVESDAVDVCLRPYSRIRDMLQLYRGSRLYPGDFRWPQVPEHAPVIPLPGSW